MGYGPIQEVSLAEQIRRSEKHERQGRAAEADEANGRMQGIRKTQLAYERIAGPSQLEDGGGDNNNSYRKQCRGCSR
jgi:hypothetical protein